MRRVLSLALAGLVLLALGAVVGRATAPTKVVEKLKTAEGDREAKSEASAVEQRDSLSRGLRSDQEVRLSRVSRPDGTRVDRATIRTRTEAETKATTEAARVEVRTEYVDRWRTEEKTKVTEAARPQWEAGLLFGYGVVGARPTYGGFLERRILGGIKAGAFVTSEKAFGAMIGFEW